MNCTECGAAVSPDWRFCSSCGSAIATTSGSAAAAIETQEKTQAAAEPATVKDPTKLDNISLGAFVVIAVMVIGIAAIVLASGANPNGSGSAASSEPEVAALESEAASDAMPLDGATTAPAPESASASGWTYSEDVDKIRNAPTYFASTTSTNTIHQDPPYDSATYMRLTLRKSPAYGVDVIFTISSGQMMCPSYEGCRGTIRFDNDPAQRVRFAGAADNASDTIFLEGSRPFIARLKSAKKLVVEKVLYEAGSPQFEFDVANLKWDH